MESHFPHAPPLSNLLAFLSNVMPFCFWLVVAFEILIGSHLRPRHFFSLFFVDQFVGTLKDRYIRKVPLPRAPQIQHASHTTTAAHNICYLAQVLRISTWSDLARSLAGLGGERSSPFPSC
jgi:hypothetical protein